jgi:hypothetical protein
MTREQATDLVWDLIEAVRTEERDSTRYSRENVSIAKSRIIEALSPPIVSAAEIVRLRALNAELVKALTLAAHVIQEDLEDLPPRSDGKDIEAHDAARAALSKATESK